MIESTWASLKLCNEKIEHEFGVSLFYMSFWFGYIIIFSIHNKSIEFFVFVMGLFCAFLLIRLFYFIDSVVLSLDKTQAFI